MTGIAILLLVASAFLHAGWNLLGKRRNPTAGFFLLANFLGTCLLTPVIFKDILLLGEFPPHVWTWLVLTGIAQALYYASLAGAYRKADLSIVYPLARSYPVLVVLAVSFLLGRKDQISALCVSGIVLLVAGSFFLPKRTFRDFRWRDYLHAGALLAVMAAFGSAGYSLCDDEALRILRARFQPGLSKFHISLLYGALEGWTSSIAFAAFIVCSPNRRRELREDCRTGFRQAFLTGTGICVAYLIVLVAMAYARNISYVVAFRLLGIPISTLLGIFVLREPRPAPKLFGICLMFSGLVLVAIG